MYKIYIYIYIDYILYVSGTKYEVRGWRCPECASWECYAE